MRARIAQLVDSLVAALLVVVCALAALLASCPGLRVRGEGSYDSNPGEPWPSEESSPPREDAPSSSILAAVDPAPPSIALLGLDPPRIIGATADADPYRCDNPRGCFARGPRTELVRGCWTRFLEGEIIDRASWYFPCFQGWTSLATGLGPCEDP